MKSIGLSILFNYLFPIVSFHYCTFFIENSYNFLILHTRSHLICTANNGLAAPVVHCPKKHIKMSDAVKEQPQIFGVCTLNTFCTTCRIIKGPFKLRPSKNRRKGVVTSRLLFVFMITWYTNKYYKGISASCI